MWWYWGSKIFFWIVSAPCNAASTLDWSAVEIESQPACLSPDMRKAFFSDLQLCTPLSCNDEKWAMTNCRLPSKDHSSTFKAFFWSQSNPISIVLIYRCHIAQHCTKGFILEEPLSNGLDLGLCTLLEISPFKFCTSVHMIWLVFYWL